MPVHHLERLRAYLQLSETFHPSQDPEVLSFRSDLRACMATAERLHSSSSGPNAETINGVSKASGDASSNMMGRAFIATKARKRMSQRKRARWKAKCKKQQGDEQDDPDSPIHSAPQDDHLVVRVDSMPVCCERLSDSAGIEQGVR